MTFDEFIAPIDAGVFLKDYWGQQPLLIRKDDRALRPEIGWPQFNQTLNASSHLTEDRIKLLMNSRAIQPELYLNATGPRVANIRQVTNFAAMGANIVVDAVEMVLSEARDLTNMLAERLNVRASANFYASFKGVQAFASHFDTHDVFAVHCAGQKRWRIYRNRAENPTEILSGEGAQADIDAFKGAVIMDVTLAPGDVLYIPHGFCHDAIATDTASLHLTLGFAPLYGTALFRLLSEIAIEDALCRAYVPSGKEGASLDHYLAALADQVATTIRSPRFRELVVSEQRKHATTHSAIDLPERHSLRFFARTERSAKIISGHEGASIDVAGQVVPLGSLSDVGQYVLDRPMVSMEDLSAQYAHHPLPEIESLVGALGRLGVVKPYLPPSLRQ